MSVMGLDIGTTGCKAVAFDEALARIVPVSLNATALQPVVPISSPITLIGNPLLHCFLIDLPRFSP